MRCHKSASLSDLYVPAVERRIGSASERTRNAIFASSRVLSAAAVAFWRDESDGMGARRLLGRVRLLYTHNS